MSEHTTEKDVCHLCGEALSRPGWKRLLHIGDACHDHDACRERFVVLLGRGQLRPSEPGSFARVLPPGTTAPGPEDTGSERGSR